MISELRAKNFILFDEIEIEFSDKMNVITGESGSGKSLFLSILKSLLGEKNELKGSAEVEARFIVEEGEFVVNLKIGPSRTSARINGSMVTLAQLKDQVQRWIDIHDQGVSQILRNPQTHTHFVDIFFPSLKEEIKNYKILFDNYIELSKLLKENEPEKIRSQIEEISNEIEGIERFFVTDEEYENMKEEYRRMANIEEILKISKELDYLISGDHGLEFSIEMIMQKLKEIHKMDGKFSESFEEISVLIEEFKKSFLGYVDSLEFDEERFLELEERIGEMEKLRRRYGPTFEEVKKHLEELKERYKRLELTESEIKNAGDKFDSTVKKMEKIAERIKEMREEAAQNLVKAVNENLKDLAMPNASLSFLHEETSFTPNGKDRIEFLGSINPGMPPLPLAKIASGGEMSRFYLAIESALSGTLPVSTIVFDEIESGIGQRTADSIANKMKEMSQNTQIIVITHMPQIAAVADKHFKIEKYQSLDSTYSIIKEINGEERKKEIKEMFGKIFE
ncbi:DNA repair protein RecN [Athalassotoga saccharophila]|uniref:DNA repair protein RecN n=1 Tax=Athalassotoga saccharophila TaxID=1441386 RepID=UPI00137A835C|nr:AAA family ATPase [Athalassotoga saccharophila]BBJ28087.1 DNA repair protein RecN [Athalassotoga saccharophila]